MIRATMTIGMTATMQFQLNNVKIASDQSSSDNHNQAWESVGVTAQNAVVTNVAGAKTAQIAWH